MKIVLSPPLVAALAAPAAFASLPDADRHGRPGLHHHAQAGHKVKKLKAGTYVFKISDKSTIHNFHLTGPGVNKKTSVGGRARRRGR